jgi:hypothetical protein
MRTLYEFLDACKERPALYPVTNADDMFIFLQGYISSSGRANLEENIESLEHFRGFGDWVQKEAGLPTNVGWDRSIGLMCVSKRETLDMFFSLLEKYKSEHPLKM